MMHLMAYLNLFRAVTQSLKKITAKSLLRIFRLQESLAHLEMSESTTGNSTWNMSFFYKRSKSSEALSHCVKYLARGGYSPKNWVGVCGPLLKTLTLFITKICNFPYPIYDLTERRKK